MEHHGTAPSAGELARAALADPTSRVALAALGAASAIAWVGLATYEPGMGAAGFLAGWTLMMAAMMLPSIAPLVLLHRGPRVPLALGYLAVWTVVGIVPFLAMEAEVMVAAPIVLAGAGLYELSPLKATCLRRCTNVAAFLMDHYRSGPFRLGVEHGLWCLGCCVGLMAVLVFAAAMGLGWAVAIAAAVFVQKVLTGGELSARVLGVGLLAAAVVVAVA
jgi:predicted metal-binding membrane protein